MKKLLLSVSALMFALSAVKAQGLYPKGAHDDFATADEYVKETGEGVYWFDGTSATTLTVARSAGYMTVTANNAGGCTVDGCYPEFGVNFGTIDGNPVTVDLSTGADIKIDIENMVNKFTYITVMLKDINDKVAKFEPNVSDVLSTTTWDDPAQPRKSLNGFTFGSLDDPGISAKARKKITIDLSSVSGKIGGLTGGAYNCDPGPYNCPATTYDIDASKIKAVLFQVNFGKDNIFVSEGDGDYKKDTFIPGTAISSYTGSFKIYDFQIGSVPTGINEAKALSSLNVYPNPAKDQLNVSLDATGGADVTLTDLFGRTVYSTTASGMSKLTVNTSELSAGMYILNVASKNGKVSRKVSIQ